MKNLIIIAVLLLILGCAILYIYKAKRNGKGCIGCPNSSSCNTKNCTGVCSYGCDDKHKK